MKVSREYIAWRAIVRRGHRAVMRLAATILRERLAVAVGVTPSPSLAQYRRRSAERLVAELERRGTGPHPRRSSGR